MKGLILQDKGYLSVGKDGFIKLTDLGSLEEQPGQQEPFHRSAHAEGRQRGVVPAQLVGATSERLTERLGRGRSRGGERRPVARQERGERAQIVRREQRSGLAVARSADQGDADDSGSHGSWLPQRRPR